MTKKIKEFDFKIYVTSDTLESLGLILIEK